MYWQEAILRLKSLSNKQLNELLKGQLEFLSKHSEKEFKDIRNYTEYVRLEIAERIGKQKGN